MEKMMYLAPVLGIVALVFASSLPAGSGRWTREPTA